MELIHASQINENDLSSFLTNNHQIDRSSLLRHGYVVQHRNMIIGCFQLDSIEQGVYWLKQLYIIQDEVNKLPVLLELIIVFAKQQEAKLIYAHSEQPVTDLLLQSLSFSLQTSKNASLNQIHEKVQWWSYQVC